VAKVDGGLRQTFRKHLPHIFWQSIEIGATGSGVPDTHFLVGEKCAGWIEHKRATENAVVFQPMQPVWISSYVRRGGICFIAIRIMGRRANDELCIAHGAGVLDLANFGISGLPARYRMGLWSGGPARWDWKAIENVLRGRF
jgi:hypothetical protein